MKFTVTLCIYMSSGVHKHRQDNKMIYYDIDTKHFDIIKNVSCCC